MRPSPSASHFLKTHLLLAGDGHGGGGVSGGRAAARDDWVGGYLTRRFGEEV
jgi:hypothetical protein